jgi:hypothetical protein
MLDNIKAGLKKKDRDVNWNDLAQDRNKWRAVDNKVMNLNFQQNVGNFVSS